MEWNALADHWAVGVWLLLLLQLLLLVARF
jgi:hypothetical protein